MMVAGFALKTVGAIAQLNYAKSAANQQIALAAREREGATKAAAATRESTEKALHDAQLATIESGEQQKSDLARQADKDRASLLAVAGGRGQLASGTFWRQMTDLAFINELDQSRVNQGVNDRVASLQADKEQTVQDQKGVQDQAGLNYYAAATDARLQKAQASQRAFFQIAGAGVEAGTGYYKHKTLQSLAGNKVT